MSLRQMAWARAQGQTRMKLFVRSDRGWVPWNNHPDCQGVESLDLLHSDGWAAYQRLIRSGYTVISKEEMYSL